jgi:hypothetical protein
MRRLAGLTVLTAFATLALAAASPASADAQSWGDRLKKKAEEAAKRGRGPHGEAGRRGRRQGARQGRVRGDRQGVP